jgi:hypothetical protein
MLHIALCHHYLWLKFIYINFISTYHIIDIYVCCLIRLHVHMLALLKKLSTKEHMSMQKVRMLKCFLYLAWENNHDGVILIFFFFFLFLIINNKYYRYVLIFCNYVNIMWELYAQRARGNKCERTLWMCFKHKTRMKVVHKI